MGWELRRGKRVYYRKEWDGRRVRSIYCGSGERGEAAAREDEERRAARRGRVEAKRAAKAAARRPAAAAPPPAPQARPVPRPVSQLRVMGRPLGAPPRGAVSVPRPRDVEKWLALAGHRGCSCETCLRMRGSRA